MFVHALDADEPVLALYLPAPHAVRPPVEPYATVTLPGQYPPLVQVTWPAFLVSIKFPAVVFPEHDVAAVAPALDVV